MLSAPIYEIKNLKHSYGKRTVLQIDSLSINKRSIIGLIGQNGSGKSTFLRLLAFVEKPSSGSILFNQNSKVSNSARFQITLLIQNPYLLKRSVFENIAYGLKIRKNCENQNHRQCVYEALSLVGLSAKDFADRQWSELSGGEAQRVALAARLILKPKVLLLDEPTANVDAENAILIKNASLKIRNEWKTTLIIASHDLSWLSEICDETLCCDSHSVKWL